MGEGEGLYDRFCVVLDDIMHQLVLDYDLKGNEKKKLRKNIIFVQLGCWKFRASRNKEFVRGYLLGLYLPNKIWIVNWRKSGEEILGKRDGGWSIPVC